MSTAKHGPAEVLAVAFPTGRVTRDVTAGLVSVFESGVVTLLDLLLVRKSDAGEVFVVEANDIDGDGIPDVEIAHPGLAGQEDVDDVAARMAPGTTALVLVIEHTWAKGLVGAMVDAGGTLVTAERIPAAVVDELVSLADASAG